MSLVCIWASVRCFLNLLFLLWLLSWTSKGIQRQLQHTRHPYLPSKLRKRHQHWLAQAHSRLNSILTYHPIDAKETNYKHKSKIYLNGITHTLHDPPPRFSFHHRVFKMCNLPSSCNLRTVWLIAVRYGESIGMRIEMELIKWCVYFALIGRHLLWRIAMPYPFESSRFPTCVSSQLRSITYSIDVDSMRKA